MPGLVPSYYAPMAGIPPLAGRAGELDTLWRVLHRLHAGTGGSVLIDGEPGIGKTRLLGELVAMAQADGVEVLESSCEAAQQTTPFAPLRRLVGRRGILADDESTPGDNGVPGMQFRVVEAFGNFVETVAASPLVIAVDDLQWADDATLLALRFLSGRIGGLPVVLAVAHRSGHRVPALHSFIDSLLRIGVDRIELGPLDAPAVAELAEAVAGVAPSPSVLARLDGVAGNPLFVSEFARAIASEAGGADQQGPSDEAMPLAFRRSVLGRVRQLPTAVQDALRVAAVLGTSFDPRHLCVALGQSAIDLAAVLEVALDAGLIGDQGDQLAFRHDLLREAVYAHIPAGVRRDMHREIARRLAESGADLLAVAQHMSLGADGRDTEAASWLRRAAASTAATPAVAAELLERARSLLAPSVPEFGEVLAELALALAWAGRLGEAEACARDALGSRVDAEAAVALRSGLLRALTWQGRPAEALAQLGLQPEESVAGDGAAMLAAETALAAQLAFQFPVAGPAVSRAEQLARATGDDVALCQALSVKAWLTHFTGQPHDAAETALQAVALADLSPGRVGHRSHPHFFTGMPLVALDRLDEAVSHLQQGRRIAEDHGHIWSLPLYHAHLGVARFVAGNWDVAAAELEASRSLADEIRLVTPVTAAASAWLAAIQVHRDEITDAERTVGEALARQAEGEQGGPLLNWARALVHEARGELTEALGLLEAGFGVFLAGGNITDAWSIMTLVRLSVQSDHLDRAAALVAVADRQADMTGTPFMQAQALRCRGLVEKDATFLVEAVDRYRACPRPAELAAGCEDAGAALANGDDIVRGVALLEEALDGYERLGAARDAARVRATLRLHGVRRTSPRRATRAVSGWESLTDAERKVVDLVVQRLSNPEVAERLFISRHTVESHLKRIYRKLEVSSRTELAAAARR